MSKYTTRVGGKIVGLVQGEGATITMNGSEIVSASVHCPHCDALYDTNQRLSGDVVFCPHCSGWATVRHLDGGIATLTPRDEPPVSWPKRNGKTRRP
jgi:hypothetical protein